MFWWYAIYLLVALEAIILILLSLPLPQRAKEGIASLLRGLWNIPAVRNVVIVVFILVLVAAVDSYRDVHHLKAKKEISLSAVERDWLNARYFRAQRNMYLASLTDFFLLLMYAMHGFICRIQELETQLRLR